MGHKIITEEDFWICTEGAIPTQFQGTRKSLHDFNNHKYITVEDKATVGWLDFGCKKLMLLYAIIAALAVVVAVAVGVLTVATGGMGLIALGAIAGLVGGGVGAIVGGLACGQLMAPGREWNSSKSDFKIQGTKGITGGHTITCKAGGTVQYAPNIKSWLGAIGYATLSYGSELVKCAFAGAAVGTGGSLLGVGSVTVAGTGGTIGTGMSLSRASMQLAWPTLRSIGSNVLTSFGVGGGWTGAGIALGSRGIFGAESAAKDYAIDAVDEDGNPVSVLDSGLKGALPEYELASRLHDKGLSGLQLSDSMFLLYLLHLKTDPPGTFRDSKGKLRNARENPRGQKPGSFAEDPRTKSSGNKSGKAYTSNEKVLKAPKTKFGKVRLAYEHYKELGWPKSRIADHLDGIDFSKNVELVELPGGKVVSQYQAPGAKKGNYFAEPNAKANELGINPNSEVNGNIVKKTKSIYKTDQKTTVLKSTARSGIKDTWSVPSEAPFETSGGGTQYHTNDNTVFIPKN